MAVGKLPYLVVKFVPPGLPNVLQRNCTASNFCGLFSKNTPGCPIYVRPISIRNITIAVLQAMVSIP